MAHFAKIENGVVSNVIVIANEALGDLEFPESEAVGQQVIADSGIEGTWKQCSYNGNFRGIYPYAGCLWTGRTFKNPEAPTE